MVRTKADAGSTKVAGAKAPRKALSTPSSSGSTSFNMSPAGKAGSKYSGGNSYNPQPTPGWQKGINSFFKQGGPKEGESSSSRSSEEDGGRGESPENNGRESPAGESGADSGKSSPSPAKEGSSGSFAKNGMISDDDDD